MSTAVMNTTEGKGTFARGIHPHGHKALAERTGIEVLPTPAQVSIPLLQSAGAPCEPCVKIRDEVKAGDKVGDSPAFISAPVHTPIAGTVAKDSVTTLPNGRHVKTLPVKAAGDPVEGQALYDDVLGGDWSLGNLTARDPAEITKAVREAGIVGMGGAAFPTFVKLQRNEKRPVDTLLVNGCECEPYLTADYRVMLEAPQAVLAGAQLAAHACGAQRIVMAVEDNKPAAIEALRKAAAGTTLETFVTKSKYPMGGEKQTVRAVLGRTIPTGGLPLDVGTVVINVSTATAIARAILRGKPLTHRVVTVTGAGIRSPKNILAPVGATYQALIDFAGGLTEDAARVIAGGPMMGFTLGDLDVPITKGTSGITVLTRQDVNRAARTDCVRCGRCVDVCPLNLVPSRLALAARHEDHDLAKRYHIMACMECGCCAYACPASIPLVQLIRMGKAQLPKD